jgi:hypothetical protein
MDAWTQGRKDAWTQGRKDAWTHGRGTQTADHIFQHYNKFSFHDSFQQLAILASI